MRLLAVQVIHRTIASLVSGIRAALKATIELEKAISEIQTIDTDRLPFRTWITQLKELSDTWGIDIMDQAEAAYQALSNQIVDGANAARFLGEANRFAVTAVTDVNTAVLAGSGAMNAFGKNALNAEDTFAKLFKTIELGRVRASELTSLGDVAILGRQAGLSLEEVLGSLATLSIQGVKANKAMTQLRGVFVKIIKPSAEGTALFEKWGFASGIAAVRTLGWVETLRRLEVATKGSTAELVKFVPRIRGISGVAALQGKGLQRLEKDIESIKGSLSSYGQATDTIMKNVGKTFDIELNKIKNLFKKEFGSDLLRSFSDLIGGFEGLSEAVVRLAKVLTYTLGAALAAGS
jgi:TP901 family phage tail tape measure protein